MSHNNSYNSSYLGVIKIIAKNSCMRIASGSAPKSNGFVSWRIRRQVLELSAQIVKIDLSRNGENNPKIFCIRIHYSFVFTQHPPPTKKFAKFNFVNNKKNLSYPDGGYTHRKCNLFAKVINLRYAEWHSVVCQLWRGAAGISNNVALGSLRVVYE